MFQDEVKSCIRHSELSHCTMGMKSEKEDILYQSIYSCHAIQSKVSLLKGSGWKAYELQGPSHPRGLVQCPGYQHDCGCRHCVTFLLPQTAPPWEDCGKSFMPDHLLTQTSMEITAHTQICCQATADITQNTTLTVCCFCVSQTALFLGGANTLSTGGPHPHLTPILPPQITQKARGASWRACPGYHP